MKVVANGVTEKKGGDANEGMRRQLEGDGGSLFESETSHHQWGEERGGNIEREKRRKRSEREEEVEGEEEEKKRRGSESQGKPTAFPFSPFSFHSISCL